jgi:hypothetical protein
MADMIYNGFKEALGLGTVNLNTDVFKVVLLTSTYSPSAAHVGYANLTNELATGDGYTQGNKQLAKAVGDMWTISGGTCTFTADNAEWTAATFTCRYAVIYDDTHASDLNICCFDFVSDKSVSSGTFTIQFNASGIITLS